MHQCCPKALLVDNDILFWLVVWNMNFMTFHIYWDMLGLMNFICSIQLGRIILTHFHIFQRGRLKPPTSCFMGIPIDQPAGFRMTRRIV